MKPAIDWSQDPASVVGQVARACRVGGDVVQMAASLLEHAASEDWPRGAELRHLCRESLRSVPDGNVFAAGLEAWIQRLAQGGGPSLRILITRPEELRRLGGAHPGAILSLPVLGMDLQDHLFYIQTRHPAPTLRQWLPGHRGLEDRLRVLRRVCDIVAHAHAAGISHCTIDSRCIQVDVGGEVLIGGWGRASVPDLGPHTDIQGLGELLREIAAKGIIHQKSAEGVVIPAMDAIVERAVQHRHQSADELVAELDTILEALTATPPVVARPPFTLSVRLGALLALLLLGLGAGVVAWKSYRLDQERERIRTEVARVGAESSRARDAEVEALLGLAEAQQRGERPLQAWQILSRLATSSPKGSLSSRRASIGLSAMIWSFGAPIHSFDSGLDQPLGGLAISENGRRGLVSDLGLSAGLFQLPFGQPLRKHTGGPAAARHGVAVTFADNRPYLWEWSPQAVGLWSMASDKAISTWDDEAPKDGHPKARAEGPWLRLGATWVYHVQKGPQPSEPDIPLEDGLVSPSGRYRVEHHGAQVEVTDRQEDRRLWSVPGQPSAATRFTPDEKRLLVKGTDQLLQVVDVATGRIEHRLRGLGSNEHVAITADGSRFLAGDDRQVALWSLAGLLDRAAIHVPVPTNGLAISPDGCLVLIGARAPETAVRLYDIATRRLLRVLETGSPGPRAVAISADGAQALVATDDGVRTWNLLGGQIADPLATPFQADEPAPRSDGCAEPGDVALVGQTMALACADGRLLLWDTPTSAPRTLGAGILGPIRAVAISPDGRFVASGGLDRSVHLWDLPTGKELWSLPAHSDAVTDLAFTSDSRFLLSASDDRSVAIWDLDIAQEIRALTDRLREGPDSARARGAMGRQLRLNGLWESALEYMAHASDVPTMDHFLCAWMSGHRNEAEIQWTRLAEKGRASRATLEIWRSVRDTTPELPNPAGNR